MKTTTTQGIPPEVRIALKVVLRHVEPGWDNCVAVVRHWLDNTKPVGRFSTKRWQRILRQQKGKISNG
jgi:hypothetical protein